jgi:adenylate cyclase
MERSNRKFTARRMTTRHMVSEPVVASGFQLAYHSAENMVVRAFDQPQVAIGRAPGDRGMVIDSPNLFRKHAEIVRDAEGWAVHDLHRGGVAVNGTVVSNRRLMSGDLIKLIPAVGEAVFLEFRLATAADRVPLELSLGDDPSKTSLVASIDLRELSRTLSKSGGEARPVLESQPVEGQLPALALLKSAGEILLVHESLDEMLQPMVDLIGCHLPGRRVAVCMSDASSGKLTPRCYNRKAPSDEGAVDARRPCDPPRPFPISRSILDEAVRARRALLVASAADDARFRTAVSIRESGIRSAICVPLYHEGHIAGAVYVDSQSEAATLTRGELEVLTVLGLMLAAGVSQIVLRGDVAREREIRGRLARYNSPQVVEQIMRFAPRQEDEMQADEHEVSVLFADLGGFTALAEAWSAAEAVHVLNLIFERWTADVFAQEGTLDKYIGDAVMAVFGAPLRQADHARRAVATALAMRRSLVEFNQARPLEQPLTVRIGINSGRVIAGDIGSPRRRAYTVIGDAVNIASRLEAHVAQPGEIVIGQATFQHVQGLYACDALGPVQLRGKRQVVEAYRLRGELEFRP